jgi:hypothetical protein
MATAEQKVTLRDWTSREDWTVHPLVEGRCPRCGTEAIPRVSGPFCPTCGLRVTPGMWGVDPNARALDLWIRRGRGKTRSSIQPLRAEVQIC